MYSLSIYYSIFLMVRISKEICDTHDMLFKKKPEVDIIERSSVLCTIVDITKKLRKKKYTKEELLLTLQDEELGVYSKQERELFNNLLKKEGKEERLKQEHKLLSIYRNKLLEQWLLTETSEAIYLWEWQFWVATLKIDILESRRKDIVIKFIHQWIMDQEFWNQKKIYSILKKNNRYEKNDMMTKSPQLEYQDKNYCTMEYIHWITIQKLLVYNQYQNKIKESIQKIQNYNNAKEEEEDITNDLYDNILYKFNIYGRCFSSIKIYDFLELITIKDLIELLQHENVNIDFNTHKTYTKDKHFKKALETLLSSDVNPYKKTFEIDKIVSYIRETLRKIKKEWFEHPDFNTANNILNIKRNGKFIYNMIDFWPLEK